GIKGEAVPPPPPAMPPMPMAPAPQVTKFKITIAPDVPLGNHDAWMVNRYGISNPRTFVVGDLVEVLEKEPNNDVTAPQKVDLNCTINGSISAPTDVDYYQFTGKKGQRVVCSCLGSSIDSRI